MTLDALAQRVQRRAGARAARAARRRPRVAAHRLVHRRRAGLLRVGDRGRRRCLHHRRGVGAAGASGARDRRGVSGLRAPRDRALSARRRWRRMWPSASGSSTRFIEIENPRMTMLLTMGDPAGIGPEIIARAFCERRCAGLRGRRRCGGDAARDGAAERSVAGRADRVATRCVAVPAALPAGVAARRPAAGAGSTRLGRCRCARRPGRGAVHRSRGARRAARRRQRHRHRADPQGRARRRRRAVSRPHRDAASAGRRHAGAHDAGQRRAARRAGDDPPVAAGARSTR